MQAFAKKQLKIVVVVKAPVAVSWNMSWSVLPEQVRQKQMLLREKKQARMNQNEIQFNDTDTWGVPEASCGVVEDVCLRGGLIDVLRVSAAWQWDEDLVSQLRKCLPGQFLLQIVFGRKVPQDTCSHKHQGRVSKTEIYSSFSTFSSFFCVLFPNLDVRTFRHFNLYLGEFYVYNNLSLKTKFGILGYTLIFFFVER